MGSLFAGGAAKASGWFDSSRPKTSKFDNLEKRGKHMTKQQRAEFLAREAAKESSGPAAPGGQVSSPLSSRYT